MSVCFVSFCMYECMYVCILCCMHACMRLCMVCLYVCFFVCLLACMFVCMFVCMYACMYVCMYIYICMYVCMYVCMFMYACVYMYVCIREHSASTCSFCCCAFLIRKMHLLSLQFLAARLVFLLEFWLPLHRSKIGSVCRKKPQPFNIIRTVE